MKKTNAIIIIIVIVLAAATLVTTVFTISSRYLKRETDAKLAKTTCNQLGIGHIINVTDTSVSPSDTQAKRCETLTVVNKSSKLRLMAFGPHEDHQPYNGITEKDLTVGKSFTVTLNQTGTYRIHDHTNDELAAYFTVSN